MIRIRPADARGRANYGWLDTAYSFSFADYHDSEEMGWGALRVINDDRVEAGKGFGMHGHRDMEIVTYVLSGALEHKDSLNNGTVIRPGDVQRMSAGKGVLHSEFNPLADASTRLLQIWILPRETGGSPSYEQVCIEAADKRDALRVIASPDGRAGSVTIRQDALIHASVLTPSAELRAALAPGRYGYVHVINGEVQVNALRLAAGDGAKIVDESLLVLGNPGSGDSEFLYFDLPPA